MIKMVKQCLYLLGSTCIKTSGGICTGACVGTTIIPWFSLFVCSALVYTFSCDNTKINIHAQALLYPWTNVLTHNLQISSQME